MATLNLAQSLDHFVVPVDDLVIAEEFYVRVFGGVITKRNGLNVRQRKRGAVPHTFIQIGGKRMGVYLQSEERAQPTSARGLPTYLSAVSRANKPRSICEGSSPRLTARTAGRSPKRWVWVR